MTYMACKYGGERGQQVTQQVEDNDKLHIRFLAFPHVAQSAHNKEEYQDRSYPLQCSDEQVAQNRDC